MYEKQGKEDGKEIYYRYYESIEDLVQYLKTTDTNEVFKYADQDSHREYSSGFHEFKTYEEALENLEFGYDKHFKQFIDNVEKAKNIVSKIEINRVGSTKRDVAGFIPIVPNALLGLPESMINASRIKKAVPKARIFIEISESGGVRTDRIIKLKSVVFALIDLIERQGIRCEVWAVENSKAGNEITSDAIKLKDYFQPLNVYKLQFPIVSPDMLRRIHFRMLETNPNIKSGSWTCGYGSPLISYRSIPDLEKILQLNEEDIYIPNTRELNIDSDDTTENVLEKLLEKTRLKNYIKYNKEG